MAPLKLSAAVLTVYLMAIVGSSEGNCPNIVSRAQWGTRPGITTAVLPLRPAPFVVIHHTADGGCNTATDCATRVRNIQTFHILTNGWADIGYNFLIGGDGQVYEGRGWGRQGAHAPGYNNQSVGIAFIGTFTAGLPTLAARNIAQQLIQCGVAQGHLRPAYGLIGHRQAVATLCPGQALFTEIQRWVRFTANPRPL